MKSHCVRDDALKKPTPMLIEQSLVSVRELSTNNVNAEKSLMQTKFNV